MEAARISAGSASLSARCPHGLRRAPGLLVETSPLHQCPMISALAHLKVGTIMD